jgi:polysaccharide deacetylase family protein (PEP-CTERM system associated)
MNVFTVDVEDWFHVCGAGGLLDRPNWDTLPSRVVPTTRRLLDALDRAQVRATFFVVGWVAERFPALVQEILAAGHEVGSHGHLHRRVYELRVAEFADDVRSCNAALTAAGAPRPASYRAPEWSINDRSAWALPVLAHEKVVVDASMAPLKLVGRIDYPRVPHVRTTGEGPIVEVPPFVADRFGQVMPLGWGWGLRMTSPRRVLRSIERANRAGMPAVLTVHPWEVDPDPPRVPLPLRLWFAHYFGLDGFERRLTEVLERVPFSTLEAVVAAVRSSQPAPPAARSTESSVGLADCRI